MAGLSLAMLAIAEATGAPPAGRRLGRPLLFAASAIRHWRSLYRLWNAPEQSLLGTLLRARPELWSLLRIRFLSARWGAGERFRRLANHCETVERLGPPFSLRPNQNAELTHLREIDPRCRLVLDSPRWLLRDGLLALSLYEGHERLYSIAFILNREADGLIAYIGGVQGRRGDDTLDRYRAFTRNAHGVRPADMTVELLRMICAALGVFRLRGVADRWRHLHSPFASKRPEFVDPVTFDYDALWRERGGLLMPDGFYDLPVKAVARPLDAVPRRRRAERRRRLEMMAAIRARLDIALAAPGTIRVEQHEPVGWP